MEKQAENFYNQYLNDSVYPLIGNKTTYLGELEGAGKKLLKVKFKGVFPSDKIPKLNDLSPYCILNLDKSTESGSHWIALAKMPNSNDSVVYDSFGRDHRKIIPNLNLSGNGRINNTDNDSEQEILETDCGARCLAWLMVFDKQGVDVAKLI
tara:strand:+ start:638 stop:1093 length:456 start_codon:yes stop_codon:yes gene_type:complete